MNNPRNPDEELGTNSRRFFPRAILDRLEPVKFTRTPSRDTVFADDLGPETSLSDIQKAALRRWFEDCLSGGTP